MSRSDSEETANEVPEPSKGEMVWTVTSVGGGDSTLVVFLRTTLDYWLERVSVLGCSTWGELRKTASPEVFQEILDLYDFEAPEDDEADLDEEEASESGDETREAEPRPPADDDAFSCEEIPSFIACDWPPDVFALVEEDLPEEVLEAYAERYETVMNGSYAEIPADHCDAVLARLATLGFEVVEEPKIEELANFRY